MHAVYAHTCCYKFEPFLLSLFEPIAIYDMIVLHVYIYTIFFYNILYACMRMRSCMRAF